MSRVGRYYRRNFGRHRGLHLVFLLTVVVVTYVIVPKLALLVDSMSGYNPSYYEPKDLTRQIYILQRGVRSPLIDPWRVMVDIMLILLVVVVWMIVLGGRRRPR